MSDRPRLNNWEHAHRYPKRVVVIWAPLHGGHEWLVMRGVDVLSAHPTHAEAFADAWARTHPKARLVPLGNDTYRVVGAMRRSAVTGRYLTSVDKGE